MIPKFNRPLSAFTLYALAGASWGIACIFFLQSLLGLDAPHTGSWTQYFSPFLAVPAVFVVPGVVLFCLGRMLELSAEAAHYTKYLCWEIRIANQLAEKTSQLAEKKQPEPRKIPPPLHFPQLDPMERVYRSVED